VAETAASIDDPVVRGAALYGWVGQHAAALPPEATPALCGQLDAPQAQACQRRMESVHLQR